VEDTDKDVVGTATGPDQYRFVPTDNTDDRKLIEPEATCTG